MANADPRQVVKVLSEYYSTSELKSLCFDIGIDYEDLGGQGKAGKARELVQFADRRGRLGEVVAYVQKTRPHVNLAGGGTVNAQNIAGGISKKVTPTIVYHVEGDLIQGDKARGDKVAGDKIISNKTTNINQQGQTVNGPQINTAGDANVGQVGDSTNIGGNQIQGDNVQGDKMSDDIKVGNVSGTGIAIGRGASAVVTMGAMPAVDDSKQKEIEQLIAELNEALAKVPEDRKEEADAVAAMATDVIEKGSVEQPNKTMLQLSGNGLKQAAENIADVMPTVVGIAAKLAMIFL